MPVPERMVGEIVIVTKDYSAMAIGTKIDRGEIQICPTCGKNALVTKNETKNGGTMTSYCHAEKVSPPNDEKSPAVIGWDECPSQTLPKSAEQE
jgi:hypothetical protein